MSENIAELYRSISWLRIRKPVSYSMATELEDGKSLTITEWNCWPFAAQFDITMTTKNGEIELEERRITKGRALNILKDIVQDLEVSEEKRLQSTSQNGYDYD